MAMIQIRNVPDDLHRVLKSRAALKGLSLSDYLLRQVAEEASRPTMEEVFERLSKLPPVQTSESAADVIRDEREARTEHLIQVLEARQRSQRQK